MYYLTIGAIFKNESHCLQEWIEHHLYHGVEHFYLINDESTDEFMKILQPYINKDIVTLYNSKNHPKYPGKQGDLYEKYFSPLLKNKDMKWLMIIDLDEFVYCPSKILDIKNVLKKYEDYALVELDWVLFGSNGHITQPKSLIEGFTKSYKENGFKQICNSSFHITCFGVHEQHAYGRTINISLKKGIEDRTIREKLKDHDDPELLINHYQCQSLELWKSVKMVRGDLDCYLKDDERDLELFKKKDRNEIEDLRLLIQNREIKYEESKNLIDTNIMINNIEYKNTDIPSSFSLLQLTKELEIESNVFCELDHLIDKSNINELIENKWKGYLLTTNKDELKKMNNLYNVKYSVIRCGLLQPSFPVSCDVLSLINNHEIIDIIWKEIPTISYFVKSPKIIILEVKKDVIREDTFINVIKESINKKYTPIYFSNNILYLINNMFITKLKTIKYISSTNPYDYLYLYNNVFKINNKYYTNELLVINTAIRNYYLTFKNLKADKEWIIKHINTYGYHLWDYKC